MNNTREQLLQLQTNPQPCNVNIPLLPPAFRNLACCIQSAVFDIFLSALFMHPLDSKPKCIYAVHNLIPPRKDRARALNDMRARYPPAASRPGACRMAHVVGYACSMLP